VTAMAVGYRVAETRRRRWRLRDVRRLASAGCQAHTPEPWMPFAYRLVSPIEILVIPEGL
jgi:hypothetical protein